MKYCRCSHLPNPLHFLVSALGESSFNFMSTDSRNVILDREHIPIEIPFSSKCDGI